MGFELSGKKHSNEEPLVSTYNKNKPRTIHRNNKKSRTQK